VPGSRTRDVGDRVGAHRHGRIGRAAARAAAGFAATCNSPTSTPRRGHGAVLRSLNALRAVGRPGRPPAWEIVLLNT